jgi:hypothetical protein
MASLAFVLDFVSSNYHGMDLADKEEIGREG